MGRIVIKYKERNKPAILVGFAQNECEGRNQIRHLYPRMKEGSKLSAVWEEYCPTNKSGIKRRTIETLKYGDLKPGEEKEFVCESPNLQDYQREYLNKSKKK